MVVKDHAFEQPHRITAACLLSIIIVQKGGEDWIPDTIGSGFLSKSFEEFLSFKIRTSSSKCLLCSFLKGLANKL